MYSNKAVTDLLPMTLYVLHAHADDHTYRSVDVSSRDLGDIKNQALDVMRADGAVTMVKLVGLRLGVPPVEGVTWTRADAFPWYVDYRERESDAPVTERFADKRVAQRRYTDYLAQEYLVSSNAVG